MFARNLDEWRESETQLLNGAEFEAEAGGSTRPLDEFLAEFETEQMTEEYQVAKPAAPLTRLRGMRKYPDDISRQNYYAFFQAAIQGAAGKTTLSAAKKAELAEKIAEAAINRFSLHAKQTTCAVDAVSGGDSKNSLRIALNLSGPWGDSFKGALQTTSGLDHISPSEAVNQAGDLADQAVLASGQLDESLWNTFMKCGKP